MVHLLGKAVDKPMPEISRFLGIVIGMFYSEHVVAHFHAVYGEHAISVEVGIRGGSWYFPYTSAPTRS